MKRFYENTIMSGAFSKALRVLALLCVLMGFSASAWAWDNELIIWKKGGNAQYYDITNGSCTVNLSSSGDYYFHIKDNNSNGSLKRLNGYSQMTSSNCTNWDLNGSSDDVGLLVKDGETGTFTFNLVWANSGNTWWPKVSVKYPVTYGFFTDGAWNIKVGDKWSNDNNGNGYGATGISDIQLGTVAAGTPLGFWAKTFKSSGSELCAPKVGIKIEGVDTDYTLYDLEWKEDLNDAKTDQLWLKDNVSYTIPSTLTEGKEYELRVYFQLQVKENGNCTTKNIFLNNGSGNFRLKFTVGSSGGGGGGGTGTEFSFVLDTKTNNFGGWIANGEVYAIFRENEGGKTGETRQVQLEICESDNRLAYYNGTTTFTRTNGTTWTPKEVYVYSGGGNDAFAKWDGTKNCMVITKWGLMTNNSGGCTMTTFTGDCDGTTGGGGGGGESSTYITFDCLYLNTGGTEWWNKKDATKGAPNFYLYLFNNTTNTKKSVLATVCPDASDIFYAEVPDGEWEGYLWVRKDPTNTTDIAVKWEGVWNQTDNCSIHKDLTTITGWGNANFTNGTYSGTCGCAGGGGDIDDDTEEYVKGTSVILSYEAEERTADNWVLSAFLEATCAVEDITEYGFFLCETTKEGGCKPTEESYTYRVDATTKTPLEKYGSFTGIASGLSNAWYGYRAFVVADGETILSPNTKYFNNKCKYELTGDTVYVTIDNTLTINNECDLKFKSINDAWATLKTIQGVCKAEKVTYGWKQDKITLIKPIVMQIVPTGINYKGFEKVGLSGGDQTTVQATFFRNINMSGGAPLIVRSIDYLNNGARATLQHVAIRRSKNITLNYLNIVGASTDVKTADNAIDIDNGVGTGNLEGLGTDWNCAALSDDDVNTSANIVIKNCEVVSYGFTCVHVSAYNGITFENNEFKAMYDFEEAETIKHDSKGNQANNTALWGASAKFLNSRNIAFIRNNFTGQHATSIFLQGSQNVLVYDNVFWHDNGVKSSANTVAIIRLISYGGCAKANPLQNIGIYYNTMFLKDNNVGEGKYHHFDFFRIGGNEQEGNTENYIPGTIEFDYNNCYSYDEDVKGKNYTGSDDYVSSDKTKYLQTMTEAAWCNSFKYNNFWSVYDQSKVDKGETVVRSAFQLGSGCGSSNEFTNVQKLVCKTSPEEPGSLVLKEDDLNIGAFIKTDVSGLLTDEMQMIDRLGNPRPYDPTALEGKGTYTLGAYQQSTGTTLSQIIWHGSASSDWDNRNNWYKPNGQLVSCVDVLAPNLEVIIPSPRSTKYPIPAMGIKNYPTLPEGISTRKFADGTRSLYAGYGEEVSAGKGKITPTQMAQTITMEYGAALVGVEELAVKDGPNRYDEVNSTLVTPRNKWILVGTVVQKWTDDTKTEVRNMISNDYYMNHFPHIYMHQAVMDGDNVAWDNTFADLTVPVPADEVYAINAKDEYGYYKLKAETYYKAIENDPSMVDDGSRPKTISFSGRFLNDNSLPNYGTLNAGVNKLICNTYPANIDVEKLLEAIPGRVQIYNYSTGSFEVANSGVILSQNGFVLSPEKTGVVELPRSVFRNDSTSVRSANVSLPEFRLVVTNAADYRSSNVLITIDELKEDAINYATDAPKLYNSSKEDKKLPEVYVKRYNKNWAGIAIPTMEDPIPVGVKTSRNNVSVKFSLRDVEGMGSIILEDRKEGKSYNLTLGEECIIEDLPKGVSENRFFLNLSAAPEEELPNDEEEGDDVTTEVEDEIASESGISIIGNSEGIIVSSSADIELQTIIVNDMSGKSAAYKVSGQYAEIKLPVAQGVYTVNVIGDTASKTGKVILK